MLGLAISVGATGLLLPRQGDNVRAAEPPAAANQKPETTPRSHVVQPGDTLAQIANSNSTSVDALLSLNGIQEEGLLQVGQTLQVPGQPANQPVKPAKPDMGAVTAPQVEADEAAFASKPTSLGKVNPKPSISLLDEKGGFNKETTAGDRDISSINLSNPQAKPVPTLSTAALLRPQDRDSIPVIDASEGQPAVDLEAMVAPDASKEQTLAVATPVVDASVESAKDEAIATVRDSSSATEILDTTPAEVSIPLDIKNQWEEENSLGGEALAMAEPVQTPAIAAGQNYKVQAGDTLGHVAQRYGVSLRDLVRANDLDSPHMIRAGQVLVVPPVIGTDLATYAMNGVDSVVATAEPVSPSAVAVQPQAAEVSSAPTASISPVPQDASTGQRTLQNSYVTGLQAEIRALQQKYEGRLSSVLRNGPAVLDVAPGAAIASPEPSITPSAAALVEEVDEVEVGDRGAISEREPVGALPPLHGTTETVEVQEESIQVALASPTLDAQNPSVRSLLGQTVSPSLPPLASADAYLPNSMRFNGYIWPTKGVFTSGYGWRWGRMHKGIDIAAPIGTPIVAAADGEVTYAGWNSGGYGNLVDIRHADGSLTRYAHNSRILVKRGQKVRQGQLIAEMGSTGRSTGPHLHFEIRKPGKGAINPKAMLPQGGLRAAR